MKIYSEIFQSKPKNAQRFLVSINNQNYSFTRFTYKFLKRYHDEGSRTIVCIFIQI